MTEDDTFRLLKRVPFQQVHKLMLNAEYGHLLGGLKAGTIDLICGSRKTDILTANGWTTVEYDAACRNNNPALYTFIDQFNNADYDEI